MLSLRLRFDTNQDLPPFPTQGLSLSTLLPRLDSIITSCPESRTHGVLLPLAQKIVTVIGADVTPKGIVEDSLQKC